MNKFIDNMIVQTLNDMLPEKVTEKLHKAFHFYDFRNKEFSEIGIKLTLTYFISIPIIIFILDAKKPTELSGYGDFLAGFFSPIAFGWLVIGYLMQNKELKNSVEQTNKTLVLATGQFEFQKRCKEDEELNIHNNAQPILDVINLDLEDEIDDLGFANFKCKIKNHGSTIYDLCIYGCLVNKEDEDLYIPINSPLGRLEGGRIDEVCFSYNLKTEELNRKSHIKIKLSLTFLDSNKKRQQTYIELSTTQLTKDNVISGYIGRTFKDFSYK